MAGVSFNCVKRLNCTVQNQWSGDAAHCHPLRWHCLMPIFKKNTIWLTN